MAARWRGGGSITGAYNIIKLDLAQSVYKAAAPWDRSANFVKKSPFIVNVTNLELNVLMHPCGCLEVHQTPKSHNASIDVLYVHHHKPLSI